MMQRGTLPFTTSPAKNRLAGSESLLGGSLGYLVPVIAYLAS